MSFEAAWSAGEVGPRALDPAMHAPEAPADIRLFRVGKQSS